MTDLENLSRIGFGCYRASIRTREHQQALRHALKSGCNLIDTASNYADGESECLVGEVLAAEADLPAFVITKTGYISSESLAFLQELHGAGRPLQDLVRTSTGLLHSIHPDFLARQMKLSCQRLDRRQLDGFLLHNPEYYFDQAGRPASEDEYYARIAKAFEFLEERVRQGRLRYYGISSNTIPFSAGSAGVASLPRLLEVAAKVSASHHFKLLQFPFNLIENDAARPHGAGQSLIEIARAHSIVTLANRPLNANSADGPIRLATYEEEIAALDEKRDSAWVGEFLELVCRRLDKEGIDCDVMEFVPIQLVARGWTNFSNPEAVDQVFDQRLFPFLDKLYRYSIDEAVWESFGRLRAIAVLYAKRNMTRRAQALKRRWVARGVISRGDRRPLPVIACESYLDAGIDHVLVGMRSVKYVDSLKTLFRTPADGWRASALSAEQAVGAMA
jgi:aryl-alcohol dehydrogenase-like predicted oxidoreductase